MPKTAEPWSLTSLREKLIKIGAKVVSHGRYVTFQMAEVAVPRQISVNPLVLTGTTPEPLPTALWNQSSASLSLPGQAQHCIKRHQSAWV